MSENIEHQIRFRVYYEDTDAGGVVYHANYLCFLERARTEWLRSKSLSHQVLLNEYGLGFMVSAVDMLFKYPAKLDDEVLVTTEIVKHSRVRMILEQKLYATNDEANEANHENNTKDWRLCVTAKVQIVVVSTGVGADDGNNSTKIKPKPLPQKLYDKLIN